MKVLESYSLLKKMKLLNQHGKKIMEECKVRARDAGLRFSDETLEYIVTNRNLIELSPKVMIPTLYDYWVQDVDVLQGAGRHKLYPQNLYETVINSRPPMSFYNDNNPDWLNVMIFYHVLAHIDFFQNNGFFSHTWDDDFVGQALADKRLITQLRAEKGRWVDYVIEFSRSIDNLVDFFGTLTNRSSPSETRSSDRVEYYFHVFLQREKSVGHKDFLEEIERYNQLVRDSEGLAESLFFASVEMKYPDFESLFERHEKEKEKVPADLMEFIMEESSFLNKRENEWMKSVMQVVRNTSLFLQPQRRSQIINEGWASYWHNRLFLRDPRIKSHEIDFALIDTNITGISRVGINPYALGMSLIEYARDLAEKGKLGYPFRGLQDAQQRKDFDLQTGQGDEFIFNLRRDCCDAHLINNFVDQDFVDRYKLFVVGIRPNPQRRTMVYYVKSRKAEDYKQMLLNQLYHPPHITFKAVKGNKLHLVHRFEGKQLVGDSVDNTMIGIEYLWGGPVNLITTRLVQKALGARIKKVPFIYKARNGEVTRKELGVNV